MTATATPLIRPLQCAFSSALLLGLATAAGAQVPIIQPGPPGEPVRQLSAEEAVEIANSSFSPADVLFMKDMIPHHHQAIERLAPGLVATAQADDGVVEGVLAADYPWVAVQWHPERMGRSYGRTEPARWLHDLVVRA